MNCGGCPYNGSCMGGGGCSMNAGGCMSNGSCMGGGGCMMNTGECMSPCMGNGSFCNNCGNFAGQGNPSYNAQDWANFCMTPQGQNTFKWWSDWIPTPQGVQWCANKRWEARRIVDGMIQQWGLGTLQSGEGVIDVGGDPGFVAAELIRSGIPVTVVDPAFGVSGKADPTTQEYLRHFDQRFLRVIRMPFDQAFVDNPAHAQLLRGASALVSLYPDEATDFCLYFTAFSSMRTALIPCNECKQYFPPHNPTYEGFVQQCLCVDFQYSQYFGNANLLKRERICNTPYCQVLLQRTPMQSWNQPGAQAPADTPALPQGPCSGKCAAHR